MRFAPLTVAILSASLAPVLQAQSPTATTVSAPIAHAADSFLTAATANGFTGVALVAKDGNVILRKGYGLSNVANKVSFSPASVVQIGSNTKDFTAVSILQLLNKKAISLDDSIGKFFANAPTDKRGITIRQLLTHRAGLPLGLGGDFEAVSRDQLIQGFLGATLQSPPGERMRYSNLGYSVLAAIIELQSKQSYDEYVRDNILKPLNLHSTGYLLPKFDEKLVASGYQRGEARPTMLMRPHLPDGHYWNLRGNGGMLSTVDDMLAFYRALFTTEKLLPTAIRSIQFPDQPAILAGSDLVNTFIYHREPLDKLEIILASNTDAVRADDVERQLAVSLGLRPPPQQRMRPAQATTGKEPVVIPDTPAGKILRDYIAVFNDGDAAAKQSFLRDRVVAAPGDTRTIEERANTMMQARSNLGPIVPSSYTEESATRATLEFQTKNGDTATFAIEIEPSDPHRIVSLRLMVG